MYLCMTLMQCLQFLSAELQIYSIWKLTKKSVAEILKLTHYNIIASPWALLNNP